MNQKLKELWVIPSIVAVMTGIPIAVCFMFLSAWSTGVPIHNPFSIASVKAAASTNLPVWETLIIIAVAAILSGLYFHQRARTEEERKEKTALKLRAEKSEKQLEKAKANSQADIDVLHGFMAAVPSNGTIRFLRTNNFAGFSFDWEKLKDIERFIHEYDGPEHEFLDTELEAARQTFRENCEGFLHSLAMNTFPLGNGRQSVPEDWEMDDPKRFHDTVKLIHEGAEAVCESYDNLVRKARKELAVQTS